MASPEQMNKYYSNAPKPPKEPDPGASEEQREDYENKEAQYARDKAEYENENGPPLEPSPVVLPPPPPGAGGGAGAGMPAARIGDMTAHGGNIVAGDPNTIIAGVPAARVSDMHVCPMVTGVVPHVGGPVLPPGAVNVLIAGLPAARVTDKCTCAGPPDVIAMGEPTVLIG